MNAPFLTAPFWEGYHRFQEEKNEKKYIEKGLHFSSCDLSSLHLH
jgi:hypothetical protein